jgi:hypothetical protein
MNPPIKVTEHQRLRPHPLALEHHEACDEQRNRARNEHDRIAAEAIIRLSPSGRGADDGTPAVDRERSAERARRR